MKILHYALGFPPYRTGGMTKYCMDMMKQQYKAGHDVGMLWPGRMGIYFKKTKVYTNKDFLDIRETVRIHNYEIINPLPVSLLDGIKETELFMRPIDKESFVEFFMKIKPDIIHVHSVMGIPIECVEAAKSLGIKTIYTTHDYFGLCPRLTMTRQEGICADDENCKKCISCNKNALSIQKIILLQSHLYRNIKNLTFVKIMREKHLMLQDNKNLAVSEDDLNKKYPDSTCQKYKDLRRYYINIFNNFDAIHFNSSITKSIYDRFIDTRKSHIISISHNNILDNKKIRMYSPKIKISYLGSITTLKGYFFIKKVLDNLYEEGVRNFELHVYVEFNPESPYIITHPPYEHKELSEVMDNTDLLIVPSMSETFGFIVPEALSYGVPVLVSENVGAKDILIQNKSGIIVEASLESFCEEIRGLLGDAEERLEYMNKYIYDNQLIKTMNIHAQEMLKVYDKLVLS